MSIKDRIIRKLAEGRASKVAPEIVEEVAGKGSEKEKAGNLAEALREMIPIVGVPEMKRRVIKGVSDEFAEKKRGNPNITEDELVGEYLDEPRATVLFKDLRDKK